MRKLGLLVDWRLLLPAVILVILSLTTLYSIDGALFRSQLTAFFVAIVAYVIFSQINIYSFKGFHIPLYTVSVVLLTYVDFFGFVSHGAARWVTILGVSFQFSEVLKPVLMIALASYLASRPNTSLRAFGVAVAFLLPVMLLIHKQPDLGNALIYGITAMLTLLVYGFPFVWFGALALPLIFLSPFLWQMLREYQRQRILTFLHPSADPLGTSYNAIQAIIAVGSGMWIGKGISQGTQSGLRFLPEQHTDFMFATFTEGFGFLGSVVILGCFLFLFYRMYRIFVLTEDAFSKIIASSALLLLLVHFFTNIGMNIGIVPVVGITLPFLSFGGNSLVSNFVILGMLSSVSHGIKERGVLEIR